MRQKNGKKKNEEWLMNARHAASLKDIAKAIETMQFRRTFGLIDEQEVWDKLLILDEMYRRVYLLQEQKLKMQLKENHESEYTV